MVQKGDKVTDIVLQGEIAVRVVGSRAEVIEALKMYNEYGEALRNEFVEFEAISILRMSGSPQSYPLTVRPETVFMIGSEGIYGETRSMTLQDPQDLTPITPASPTTDEVVL